MGTSDHNFSSVVSFLNRNLRKTSVQLAETPCYFLVGKEAKLEVTVFANPGIASIDVRMIKINNFDIMKKLRHKTKIDHMLSCMF